MAAPTTSVFQKNLYEGKVAFITGGGSGICKGIAEALMRHGAKTAIYSRSLDKLQTTAKDLEKATGKECVAYAGDVRSYPDVVAAMKKCREHFGKIDIVVCGAAGNFLSTVEGISANGFKSVIDIDLIGTFNTAKAALPHLKESKGSLLSISATFHYVGSPLQAHCAAAKAGVDALTRTLAVEWGQYDIRVNAIAPGKYPERQYDILRNQLIHYEFRPALFAMECQFQTEATSVKRIEDILMCLTRNPIIDKPDIRGRRYAAFKPSPKGLVHAFESAFKLRDLSNDTILPSGSHLKESSTGSLIHSWVVDLSAGWAMDGFSTEDRLILEKRWKARRSSSVELDDPEFRCHEMGTDPGLCMQELDAIEAVRNLTYEGYRIAFSVSPRIRV
ncbi:hypothetical protein HDU86_005760 [Geranomyces michiganensis]|nr:hypothetical protein HDU86_005760 [Geranomyces michiganensis]